LGFDSRLQVLQGERLPVGAEPIADFQIVDGSPTLVAGRELVIFDKEQVLRLQTPFQAAGIVSNGSPDLVVMEAKQFYQYGSAGWAPSKRLPAVLAGSIHNSGAPLPLLTITDADTTGFLVFRGVDSTLPIARVQGKLHAVSWNTAGLAAIVGSSLVTWEAGGSELRTLQTDQKLAGAQDICFLGAGRVLVSTKREVYLITRSNSLAVFGAPASCRFSGGMVYFLDAVNRMIWTVSGIEHIGQQANDRSHALGLLDKAVDTAYQRDPNYLEASRILGCQEARKQLAIQHGKGRGR
jgi:hypothetical protein